MGEWLSENWMALTTALVGMLVCTGGGLLAVSADRERPALFVPAYIAAVLLFVGGLFLIMYCDVLWTGELDLLNRTALSMPG